MAKRTAAVTSDTRCVHPQMRSTQISLPLIDSSAHDDASGTQHVRRSKNSRRRAIVLAIVQGLIVAHVVLWLLSRRYNWFGGETLTPIEPSESMEFSKHGIVNAGLVFFVLALLSTLVLGRWFCGWGCHVVLLQDLCGWVMKKCGIRPKAFRSRFLIYVPLLLALYMFIWPMVYRWAVIPLQEWASSKTSMVSPPEPIIAWRIHSQLTTPDFWQTFAGAAVAIPFLAICGFATVYFLGAKGFCTYGCPYGGFFAPLDKLSPGRIRVTDACEGCGHCTAVCTSNVRVHEEVREYGMVVDPGCMKCLDCVSVCPNEALYFGFGRAAIAKGEAKHEAPRRRYDLTLTEEFVCAAVFGVTFFGVRGVYGVVPMLMAVGIAGCVTFLTWKCLRLIRDDNVTFHRSQLKLKGSLQRAGWVMLVVATLAVTLTVHSAAINTCFSLAGRFDDRVLADEVDVLSRRLERVTPQMQADASTALKWYGRASSFGHGGWGFPGAWEAGIQVRCAWLWCVNGEFDRAEALLRNAVADSGDESVVAALAMLLRSSGDPENVQQAITLYEDSLQDQPSWNRMLRDYEPWALSLGRVSQVIEFHRRRLELFPFDRLSLRGLTIVLLQNDRYDEGLAAAKRWADSQPRNPEAHRWNAIGMASVGRGESAIASARLAVRYAPVGDRMNRELLAQLLEALGNTREAAEVRSGG